MGEKWNWKCMAILPRNEMRGRHYQMLFITKLHGLNREYSSQVKQNLQHNTFLDFFDVHFSIQTFVVGEVWLCFLIT